MFEFTYQTYCEAIDCLVQKIQKDELAFDYIVGIARGGAIPAVHLSHRLNIPCRVLHWQTRDGQEKDGLMLRNMALDLKDDKSILLVDDIFDTGKTITEVDEKIVSYLTEDEVNKMNNISTCSLVYRTSSLVKPDYTYLTDPEGWVNFFWEV